MRVIAGLVVLTAACNPLLAQGWMISASAPSQGTSISNVFLLPGSGNPFVDIVPVGNVAVGPFLQSHSGNGCWAEASWSAVANGSAATLQFSASMGCNGTYIGGGMLGSASVSAQLDIRLEAPTQSSGRLRLTPVQTSAYTHNSYGTAYGSIVVDVDADGTTDFIASTDSASSVVDLPLDIPVGGAVVRLTFDGNSIGTWHNNSTVRIAGEFFAGEPVVTEFATTGAGTQLSFQQEPSAVTFTLSEPTHTPLLIVFGTQAVAVPVLPTVTSLVSLDWSFATGSITFDPPQLPSGAAFYCQGLTLDASNTLRSSRSLRVLYP